MTASSGMRAAALAGVALVALAIALAITHNNEPKDNAPTQVGLWYTVLAAPYTAPATRKSACGVQMTKDTVGVAHPTLPCGVRIFITFHGHTVLVPVVDRGPYTQGREFDLTDALARRVGLRGVQEIHWSYAESG